MTKTSSRSSSTTGSRREKVTKRKLSSSSSSSSSSSDCSNNTNTNTLKSFTTSILPTSPTRSCNDNGVSNNSGEFVVEGHLWPRIQLTSAKKNKESPSCLSATTTTTISASTTTTTTMTSNNNNNDNNFNATDFPSLMLPNMLHPAIKTTTTTTTMIDPATIPTKPVLDFKAITPTTKKRIMTKFSVPVTTGSMWPRVMGKTQRLSSKRYHHHQQRRRRGGGALKPIVSVD